MNNEGHHKRGGLRYGGWSRPSGRERAVGAVSASCVLPWTPALTMRSIREYGIIIVRTRSEEHTSELQSHLNLVCRLLLEKKKKNKLRIRVIDVFLGT